MAEHYRLRTPESVDIDYDLAGIGTRFLAALIDSLVILGAAIVILFGGLALFAAGAQNLAAILWLTLYFLLIFGYYIIFETLWNGQTPGKRAMNIRVIKTSGYPIGFVEALVRNLVRIVDALPTAYLIGAVTMFISPESRRLGDYAAGTIVVKERSFVKPAELIVAAQPLQTAAVRVPDLGEIDPDELRWELGVLGPRDLQIVRDFLDRAGALPPAVRKRIGDDIASRVAARIGARDPLDAVQFLERVTYLHTSL